MKKVFLAFLVVLLGFGFSIDDAEARRLGGGRSFGMQRQSTPPASHPSSSPSSSPAASPQQAIPARQQTTPTGANAASPAPQSRSWLGPIAGLAAGIGLAALFSHFGLGAGFANIVMIGLLIMAGIFVFKMIFRRNPTQPAQNNLQYAGQAPSVQAQTPTPPLYAGSNTPEAPPIAGADIPADFDVEGFLRVAKGNFIRLQAANDAKNLADIREFVSPEVYAEIKLQMNERSNTQQTDVVTLDSKLLELTIQGDQHVASVLFSGMIREESQDSVANHFEEIWHLAKPIDGSRGWTVAGIQQIQ